MISRKRLVEFWEKHPDARAPLAAWFTEVKRARWKSTADIRAAFRSADFVRQDRVVFNATRSGRWRYIGGNKYRLIVRYRPPIVYIRFIGTHSEYDRIDASQA